jgi:hypothetical protein
VLRFTGWIKKIVKFLAISDVIFVAARNIFITSNVYDKQMEDQRHQ